MLGGESELDARARHARRLVSVVRRRCGGARLHWIGSNDHLALDGLAAPATKNTRSNPLSVSLSKLPFRLGLGDLSKIDMRMDLVHYSDLVIFFRCSH
jgi:hypothetical protein